MPGPSRFRGSSLGHAITTNKVGKHVIDERVREMLKLVNSCAASEIPENAPEVEDDSPESRALLRELATSSIVLLKNENQTLPFSKTKSVSFGVLLRNSELISWKRQLLLDQMQELQLSVVADLRRYHHTMRVRHMKGFKQH